MHNPGQGKIPERSGQGGDCRGRHESVAAVTEVRTALTSAGQLALIENPLFVSIHSEDPDAPDMPLAGEALDTDKRLIIRQFMSSLKDIINELPDHQSRLLMLRYKYHLSAKDILGFSRQTKYSPVPGKQPSELKEQDIFYGLNVALKDVFRGLKKKHRDLTEFGMNNLKHIFEEIY